MQRLLSMSTSLCVSSRSPATFAEWLKWILLKKTYKIYIMSFYLLHVEQQTAGDPQSLISWYLWKPGFRSLTSHITQKTAACFAPTVIQLFAWYSYIIMIHLYSVCCDTDKNYMKTGGTGIYLSQLCKCNPPHSELWLGVNKDVSSDWVRQKSGITPGSAPRWSFPVWVTAVSVFFSSSYVICHSRRVKSVQFTIYVPFWNFYKTCHHFDTAMSGFLIKPPDISRRPHDKFHHHHVIMWQQKTDLPDEKSRHLQTGLISSQNMIISEH